MSDLVETLRCSIWTRAQGVDPIGTAGRFDAVLLVEWPLPWPPDVAEIPALTAASADPRARVMTVVPIIDDALSDGLTRVVHRRRVGTNRLEGVDHRVARADVPELLTRLLEAIDEDTVDWPSAIGASPPEVLVCAHGRRDPCCGRWGTLLHVELAARSSAVRVWRCSHTGGHRFAPTAVTFPDGRAWAYVDADLLESVIDRTAELDELLPHDRGTTALDMWAQVAERELFARTGWTWLDHDVTDARTTVADDGRSASVHLRWRAPDGGVGGAVGEVEVTRSVPVLVCGLPPESAKKTSVELALRSLAVTVEG
ncbi:MAG: sucrase ferredoxin [Acidimicrobiales bacterium]